MLVSDVLAKVAKLKHNGMKPQDDGLYPFVLTPAEWSTLCGDIGQHGFSANEEPPAPLLSATKSYTSEVLNARFFVLG